jgi:hypothetical protein
MTTVPPITPGTHPADVLQGILHLTGPVRDNSVVVGVIADDPVAQRDFGLPATQQRTFGQDVFAGGVLIGTAVLSAGHRPQRDLERVLQQSAEIVQSAGQSTGGQLSVIIASHTSTGDMDPLDVLAAWTLEQANVTGTGHSIGVRAFMETDDTGWTWLPISPEVQLRKPLAAQRTHPTSGTWAADSPGPWTQQVKTALGRVGDTAVTTPPDADTVIRSVPSGPAWPWAGGVHELWEVGQPVDGATAFLLSNYPPLAGGQLMSDYDRRQWWRRSGDPAQDLDTAIRGAQQLHTSLDLLTELLTAPHVDAVLAGRWAQQVDPAHMRHCRAALATTQPLSDDAATAAAGLRIVAGLLGDNIDVSAELAALAQTSPDHWLLPVTAGNPTATVVAARLMAVGAASNAHRNDPLRSSSTPPPPTVRSRRHSSLCPASCRRSLPGPRPHNYPSWPSVTVPGSSGGATCRRHCGASAVRSHRCRWYAWVRWLRRW